MPMYSFVCSVCGARMPDVVVQCYLPLDSVHMIIYPEPIFCVCGANQWQRVGIEITADRGSTWTRECLGKL
jgi:hypothetical protein